MLSDLLLSVTDAILSYAIDKLDPAETIKSWLKREPARLAFQKALARAYSAFARQYPEYVQSLFDLSFLGKEAAPELAKFLVRSQHPDPALLAQAWGESLGADAEFSRRATKPTSDFLLWLEAELKGEQALQPLFDSRALDNIEAGIEKLTQEIQRGLDAALKAANNYQQVTIHIGGDVKGDGIIIGNNNQLTINKYDYSTNYFYSGDFVSLNEYYIPPDGIFQRVRVDEFVGRDWLTAKVDAFLNDPNRKSGAFLLVGDAGVGKTAFMAHLVKERRYLHLFAEQVPGQAMLQRALQSLGSQLVTRYQIDPYKDRDTLTQLAVFPDFLERLLRLAASTLTNGEKIVIVCDALDEAGVFPDHFVFGLPKELPDGVYFLLSQRPVHVKLPNFEPVIEKLEAQGEGNLQDIEAYLSAVAKRPEVAGQIRSKEYSEDFFIQTLKEKSQGVWMYLHYIIKEIESGARAPLDLANLPTGLVGYYAEYWDTWRTGKRGKGEDAWDELYAPLLTTLAAAQEAITVETLIQWADVTAKPREVTRLLNEAWRAFITEKEVDEKKAYTPYHLSFKDFITGKVDTHKLSPAQANLVKDLAAQTVDTHKRIVNDFEKECNGEWEKLVEQDYPRLHLTAHLNGAGEYEKLPILITEGDEKIKWAEAREKKEETYAGYLNDLAYVWDYAERKQNYAMAIRCMLIENSIHSLASNTPPKLLVELAKSSLWSYARCLSIIRQKSNDSDVAESLILLFPILPPVLLQEAFAISCKINDSYDRDRTLTALIPYLDGELQIQALRESLLAMQGIKNTSMWSLSVFARYSNEELKAEALGILFNIEHQESRVNALLTLAPYLSTKQNEQIFSAVRDVDSEYVRASSLSRLIPYLSDDLKTQALSLAREMKDEYSRISALLAFAKITEESLKNQIIDECLIAAHEIKDDYFHVVALSSIAQNLDDELKILTFQESLSVARAAKDAKTRVNGLMSSYFHINEAYKPQILQEALSAAYEIEGEDNRSDSLIYLAKYLGDDIKLKVCHDAFLSAQNIKDESHRTRILSEVAPYLREEIKAQALSLVHGISNQQKCAEYLSNLAPHLNSQLNTQALSIARGYDAYPRATALSALAKYTEGEIKTQVLREVLSTVNEIKDEYHRSYIFWSLAPHLDDALKKVALIVIDNIKDENHRADSLSYLAPYLNDDQKSFILSSVGEIQDNTARSKILSSLAPHINDQLKLRALSVLDAINDKYAQISVLFFIVQQFNGETRKRLLHSCLSATAEIKNETVRARLLSKIAPNITDELKGQALSIIRSINNDFERSYLLPKLIQSSSEGIIEQILCVTREINGSRSRAEVLSDLIPHLNSELKIQVLHEILDVFHEIDNQFARIMLVDFVQYLNDDLKESFLYAICKTLNEDQFQMMLGILLPYLNDDLKSQAFSAVLKIENDRSRATALSTLIPCFGDRFIEKTFLAVREINDEAGYAEILIALSYYSDNNLKAQIFESACEIQGERYRANVFLSLIRNFSNELNLPILSAIYKINDDFFRARTLSVLLPNLDGDLRAKSIQDILYVLKQIKNAEELADIFSVLVPNLTDDTLTQALLIASAIENEIYRVKALSILIPHLDNDRLKQVLQDSFSVVFEIEDEDDRVRALSILFPRLNDDLKAQALAKISELNDENNKAHALSASAQYLSNELRDHALFVAGEIKEELARVRILFEFAMHFDNKRKAVIFKNLLLISSILTKGMPFDPYEELRKLMTMWAEIQYEGMDDKIYLLFKSIANENREAGLEILALITPALIHFRGPEIADELYRAITDVTRWWP